MKRLKDLDKLEFVLGRKFQKQSREATERYIAECKATFLAFFRSRGFYVLNPGTAYGENQLSVWDGKRMVGLEIADDPENNWSGPPQLRIGVIVAGILQVLTVQAVREFPSLHLPPQPATLFSLNSLGIEYPNVLKRRSLERLREMIAALPTIKYSIRCARQNERFLSRVSTERFENFSSVLESLFAATNMRKDFPTA